MLTVIQSASTLCSSALLLNHGHISPVAVSCMFGYVGQHPYVAVPPFIPIHFQEPIYQLRPYQLTIA